MQPSHTGTFVLGLMSFRGDIGTQQMMSILGFPFRTSQWMIQIRVSDALMAKC
jgi:hypothetical protein